MARSRRASNVHRYEFDRETPSKLPDGVGTEYLENADSIVTIRPKDDEKQPARIGLFEDAGLVLFAAGYNLPLGILREVLDDAFRETYGFTLREAAEDGEAVILKETGEWKGQWFSADDPRHLFVRIRLLGDFDVDLRYEEEP